MTDILQNNGDSQNYSEANFWEKLKKFALQAGREVTEKALILFYAAQQPGTPAWAKTVIVGALAYFILPTDTIPDVVPIVGYTDDLGALAAALLSVAMYITPEVKELARKKMQDWFSNE